MARFVVVGQPERGERTEVGADGDDHRERRTHQPDQPARQRRPEQVRQLAGRLELSVGLRDPSHRHQGRDDALVGDVEEDRRHAQHQGHHVELPDVQDAEPPQHRDGRQGEGADEIGPDHHRPLPHPVDPGAGGQPDQQEGGHAGRVEDADLSVRGVQQQHRDHRQRQAADLLAHLAQGLARPEGDEVAVAQQRDVPGSRRD